MTNLNVDKFNGADSADITGVLNLLYKAEKPSVRLRHGIISVVLARIDLGLGLCIAESFET